MSSESARALTNNDILWIKIFKDGKSTFHGPFINEEPSISRCIQIIDASKVLDSSTLQRYRDCMIGGIPIDPKLEPEGNEDQSLQTVIQYHKDIAAKLRAAETFSMNVYVVGKPTMGLDNNNDDIDRIAAQLYTGRGMVDVGFGIEAFLNEDEAFGRAEMFLERFVSKHGFSHQSWKRNKEQREHWPHRGIGEYEIQDVIGGYRLKVGETEVNDFVVVFSVYCKLHDASEYV